MTRAAIGVLQDCAREFGFQVKTWSNFPLAALPLIDVGQPFPQETLEGCLKADAVLLGAVGGPKWDSQPLDRRPEAGLLALRQALGVYANVRPIQLREPLRGLCPLRLGPETEGRFRDYPRAGGRHLFRRAQDGRRGRERARVGPGQLQRAGDRAHHAICVRAGPAFGRGG